MTTSTPYTLRWHLLPGFSRAFVIWWPWRSVPTMYVPRSREGDPALVERTVWHERVHVRQWVELGRLRFTWLYFTDGIALAVLLAFLWWLAPWQAAVTLMPCLALAAWYDGRLCRGRAELEAPAFAESVRWYRERMRRDTVAHYSVALSRSYWLGPRWHTGRCRRLIQEHL